MTREERTKLWLAGIASAAVLTAAAIPLLFSAHLPEPIATHWSLTGVPNGKMGRATALLIQVAAIVVPTLLSWPRSGRPVPHPGSLLGGIGFLSCLVALVSVCGSLANWDRAEWREARLSPFGVWLAVAVSMLVALALSRLARRWEGSGSGVAVALEPLAIAPTERVFWANGASNAWLGMATFALALAGMLQFARAAIGAGAVLVSAALTLELFSRIRVTVNGRFLTIHYGHLGWLRQRIAVNRIVSATSAELLPMAHGGWGYRGSLALFRRAAVVVRRGAALQLELVENRRFSVTVDDAMTAAKLLRGLVQRQGRLDAVGPVAPVSR
jgi:hypothetical protein